jgi:cholesterol oxidase
MLEIVAACLVRTALPAYQNLLVCDGAAMPANPRVNPSLTITALAEHAMSEIAPMRRLIDAPENH